jgi:hypothetical protein
MKKILTAAMLISFVFAVAGCDNAAFDNAKRKVVRAKLNDPDSAKWGKDEFVYKNHACIVVNAKNKFGGYTGDQTAWLTNLGGENWFLDRMDDNVCYEAPLRELAERDVRKEAFESKLVNALNSKGLYKIQGDTLPVVRIDDEKADKCLRFANNARSANSLAEDKTGTKDYEYWSKEANEGLAALEAGKCK